MSLKRSVINERDCILAVSRDINERKLAEQKLQALSNRQQALLASVPDIIMEVDAENNYTWSNPAGYEFFGKDVLGHEAANYFEGEQDSYNLIQPLWNSDENVIYVESWQRRKDGQKRLLAWWCRVLKDEQGNVTGSLSTARDITEQKQTELLLQEWKSRYETAVRASGHLLYDWNSTTNEVVYGGDIEKILGYTPAEMEGGLGRWQELIHPEDQDHFKAIIEQLIATGTAANLEYRIRKKDGSYIYIEDEGNFIVDADGQATQMIGFAKDITNKKKVEEALRMSDDIVQAIPSGLFTYRYEAPDKLVLLDGNPSAVRLTGIPVNDWIGREFNEIWPEAAQGGITQNYLNVMQSGIPYETDDTIYKDNRLEGAFKVVAFPMGEDRLGVAFENVTERKQAEEALRNSEAKYKSLFDNSLEGIGISQGNQVIAANQALLDIFGYDTLEEFIQIPLLDNVAPESQKMIQNLMDQGKKGDLGPTKFEYQIIRKNGEKRDLEISRTNISLEEERFTQSTFRDITERKRSEEILRDNEELLNNIFESMSDGILVLDRDFNYTHWNRAMEKISTTPRETVINRNKSPWEIFPHLAEQGVDQMMQQAMQGDYVHRENIRYQLSDGAEGYTSEIFLPLKTATGQIRGIVGVIRDVTERHQAEIALKESQERYKTLFDGAPDAIFLAEAETGKIIDANSMACQMTLKSHDEIVGMHQSELHPPETENYAKRAFTEHLTQLNHDDQVQPLVYQLMRSDGTSVSVEIMAQAINIKGQPVVQGVFRDISERLHAEEMRKESEQKYLTLFEHAMDGIITMKVSDENAYITDCNSQVAKMFGHRVDEIVGKSPADFSPLVQPDGAGSKTRVNEIAEMAMADRPRYYEWTHCRQDGACFDTEVTVNRIDVGPASYLLAIVRDITERKQAERALAESESKFRNIYQQSPQAVEIFDAQGYFQDVNQAGLDLFGVTDVVELKGLSLFENPNIPTEIVQKLRQGQDVRYEVRFDFEKIRKHNLYRTFKTG
ncbi:MAG: PAS domain S-box protein, partial [Planctomycetes bacterium]|nr:PAS domain S-box protein [Planctomycetota bacterium]